MPTYEYYRIVDVTENRTVAESMTLAQAHETVNFYRADYPTHKFEIESYTRNISTVRKGFGRDPDLH